MKKFCITIKSLDQYPDLYMTKTQEIAKTSGSEIMLIKIILESYLTYVSFFSFIFRTSKTNLPHNIL